MLGEVWRQATSVSNRFWWRFKAMHEAPVSSLGSSHPDGHLPLLPAVVVALHHRFSLA
jgi:hypothetical protein